MKAKNRYYSRSRISEAKFRQIIRFFAMDFTASDTAKLTNISCTLHQYNLHQIA